MKRQKRTRHNLSVQTLEDRLAFDGASVVALDDAYSVGEDDTLVIGSAAGLLANDTGATGALLLTQPAHGSILLSPDGAFTYTAEPEFFGVVTFTYQATGLDGASVASVRITVNFENDWPVATPMIVETVEDTPVIFALAATDADVGQELDYMMVTPVVQGRFYQVEADNVTRGEIIVSIKVWVTNPNHLLMYVPAPNMSSNSVWAVETFQWRAEDPYGGVTFLTTVGVYVTPVNDAPQADDRTELGANNDTSTAVFLDIHDVEGDALTVHFTALPERGTLYVGGHSEDIRPGNEVVLGQTYSTNEYIFVAEQTWDSGSPYAQFSYYATDTGGLSSEVATNTIEIAYINLPPVPIGPTTYAMHKDQELSGIVLEASDPDGDFRRFMLTALPEHGKLYFLTHDLAESGLPLELSSPTGKPQLRYVPDPGFEGDDHFEYFVTDGIDRNPADFTVTLQVGAENTAPIISGPTAVTAVVDSQGHSVEAALPAGMAIADPNSQAAAGARLTLTVRALVGGEADSPLAAGQIVLGAVTRGVTATHTSGVEVQLEGTLAALNSYLLTNRLGYSPEGASAAARATSLVFQVDDHGVVPGNFPRPSLTAVHHVSIDYVIVDAPLNTPPVASGDVYVVSEGGEVTTAAPGVLANDSDADGDALTAILTSAPVHGTLTLHPDGSFTYRHDGSETVTDAFTYQVDDGSATSAPVTVTLSISPVNDAPVAQSDAYTLAEDAVFSVPPAQGVLANDTDLDGDALQVELVSGPAHGTLTLHSDGSFTYLPVGNYSGPDSFTYQARDGGTSSSPVVVSLQVSPVNDAPVAAIDLYGIDEDRTLNVAVASGLLANDADVEGSVLNARLLVGPSHGSLTLNADGSFVYLPAANFSGVDGFSYLANDGTADSEPISVRIVVAAVNDAPVATSDAYSLREDGTLSIPAAAGVLANDSDAEGGSLRAVLVTSPAHGTLLLNSNGSFTYTPAANYSGPDSFTYRANDGSLNSPPVAVSLQVAAVNDPPVATSDSYSTDEDRTLTVIAASGLLANDRDVDNASLRAVLVSGPAHGKLTLSVDGAFTYVPAADYFGPDSFSYKASDGVADSNTVSVALNVGAVNDAPVVGGRLATMAVLDSRGKVLHAATVSGVTIADDSPTNKPLTVTVKAVNGLTTNAANGRIEAASGAGIKITRVSGVEVRLEGTLSALNSYLDRGLVSYSPPTGGKTATSATHLRLEVNDLGWHQGAAEAGRANTTIRYLSVSYVEPIDLLRAVVQRLAERWDINPKLIDTIFGSKWDDLDDLAPDLGWLFARD